MGDFGQWWRTRPTFPLENWGERTKLLAPIGLISLDEVVFEGTYERDKTRFIVFLLPPAERVCDVEPALGRLCSFIDSLSQ